jgi:hypothetical protein
VLAGPAWLPALPTRLDVGLDATASGKAEMGDGPVRPLGSTEREEKMQKTQTHLYAIALAEEQGDQARAAMLESRPASKTETGWSKRIDFDRGTVLRRVDFYASHRQHDPRWKAYLGRGEEEREKALGRKTTRLVGGLQQVLIELKLGTDGKTGGWHL